MSSVFEHLSPQISVTFRVNSLPPVKMLLIRPPWAKSAEDLALVVPDTHSGRTLLAAYRWYIAGHTIGECFPEPVTPVYHREVLRYLFVADQQMSLDGLLSIMTPTDLQRLGEYPDLSEEDLTAEKALLRKHVPDGTRVTAYVNNTTLAGWIQDGRFMAENSQMVHSAVFAFWAGSSAGTNPHDVLWIHTTSGSEPLAGYLKKTQTQTQTKLENAVVYPCATAHAVAATAAEERDRLSAAVRAAWTTPAGMASLVKLTSATVATATVATVQTPQQRLDAAKARTTELQLELGLWKLIQTQTQLNKELEAELETLKATLV